jgi:hypothetical protein
MEAPDVDLLGLYWTTSGPVEVGTGREWSLFDFADRWGVEVLSQELRSLPMEQIFDRAHDTTIAQFRTGKELP